VVGSLAPELRLRSATHEPLGVLVVGVCDSEVAGAGDLVNIASLTSTKAEPPEWPKRPSGRAGARSNSVQEGESITSRVNKGPKAKGGRRIEGCRRGVGLRNVVPGRRQMEMETQTKRRRGRSCRSEARGARREA